MQGVLHPDFAAVASALRAQLAAYPGGAVDGVRLLSRRTLQRATRVQERARGRRVRGAFGHFGFGGSGGWADPHRDLAVALIVNSGMGSPFGDLRILRLSGAALAAVERRPPAPRRAAVTALNAARALRAVGR